SWAVLTTVMLLMALVISALSLADSVKVLLEPVSSLLTNSFTLSPERTKVARTPGLSLALLMASRRSERVAPSFRVLISSVELLASSPGPTPKVRVPVRVIGAVSELKLSATGWAVANWSILTWYWPDAVLAPAVILA